MQARGSQHRRRRPAAGATLLGGLLLSLSCTAAGLRVPGLADEPTHRHRPGAFVWYDLLSEDVDGAKRFYGALFGWTFETVGVDLGFARTDGYTIVRHRGRPIAGIVDATLLPATTNVSQWIPSLSVPDVDAAARTLQEKGGRVLVPARDVEDRGRLAVVADAEGALLTLVRAAHGDPVATGFGPGDFLWTELWTGDVATAASFYQAVVGWVAEDHLLAAGGTYRHLELAGQPQAGLLPNPVEALPATWVAYLQVDDTYAIANRVRGLGGRVAGAPRPNPNGGEVAVIVDPSGAGFLIQRFAPGDDGGSL